MPLGALTALTLSTAVIQFIDFAAKLVSKGYKIYNEAEGTLVEYTELDTSARKIVQLNNLVIETYDNALKEDSYRSGGSIPMDSEAHLRDICRGCNKAAEKLVAALERLKSPEKRSKWKSFRQAFKSLWGKSGVIALKNELDVHRDALNTTLLVSLKYNLYDVKRILESRNNDYTWEKKLVDDVDQHQLRHDKAGDVAQFGHHLSQAALKGSNRELETQLLRQLDFQDRSDRGDRIPKAHQKTFQWIYASQSELEQRNLIFSSFADWLESKDNLYWITGKPGSGKSTLMKFILTDPRTQQHLQVWAQGRPLIVASFYFWNSGSKTQMSEAGMLRTILYEALSQWPQRIAELFPRRWATSKLVGADPTPWAVAELRLALDVFVKGCVSVRKLCLFVDGLDECSGEHQKLASLFTQYLSLKGVKCCLASRPWPVFEDAFCKRPSLMLQELTFGDILRFANEILCSSRGFAMLEDNEPQYASKLVFRIAKKSSGVFLWVRLVVHSLLTGLVNCDRISDLEKRLEEIPGDLEELYEKMLRSIEKFYAGHASQFFQLIRESQGTATALTLSFADEEDGIVAFDTDSQPLSDEAKTRRYEMVKKRLESRCKGFLEIPKEIDMTTDESPTPPPVESDANTLDEAETSQSHQISIRMPPRRLGTPVDRLQATPYPQQMRSSLGSSSTRFSDPTDFYNSLSPTDLKDLQIDPVGKILDRPLRVPQSRRFPLLRTRQIRSRRMNRTSNQMTSPIHDLPYNSSPPPPKKVKLVPSADDNPVVVTRPRTMVNPADFKIAYLHRTARDFLEKPDIWSIIMEDSPDGFDVQRALMRTLVLALKTSQPSEPVTISNLITWCLQYTATIELRFQSVPLKQMNDIMSAATDLCKRSVSQSSTHIENTMVTQISTHGEAAFLLIAAQYNLQSFIQNKLANGVPFLPGQPSQPLLNCVVRDYKALASLCERSEAKGDRVPDVDFIRRLLNQGNNPNESFGGQTAWERVLVELATIPRADISPDRRKRLLLHWAKIVEEFIKHDADPYATKNGASANVIREAFGYDFPKLARAFENVLSKSQRSWGRLGRFLSKSTDSSKSIQDITPLFRQIQLENAQLPGHSLWEQYKQCDQDPSSKSSGHLGALRKFEEGR